MQVGARGGRGRNRGQQNRRLQDRGQQDDGENDAEQDAEDFQWSSIHTSDAEIENEDFPFLEDQGLSVRIDPNSNELAFLELYLTNCERN